jgi:long-chain fatty acid transport protein
MRKTPMIVCGLALAIAGVANARPYPAMTGISAAADSANVAGNNPAAMTRFDSRNTRFVLLSFFTDNTWDGQLGATGSTVTSEDSSTTIIPSGNMVMPLKNDWFFGFTMLGSGSSEDFADGWPGRYFMEEYDLVYLSAYPSLAKKVNDKLSLGASLALTYTNYEQVKAVPNVDPGFGDGRLDVDADGTTVGFSLSSLYEFSEQTRVGLVYRSELDAELEGDANFSDLGPTTESILDAAGLLNAAINIDSRTPQAVTAGLYHEFSDGGAVVFDAVWADFSEFKLSEVFVNGDQLIETSVDYDDIFAFSAGYSRPVSDRLTIGFGALYVDDMVSDDERTLTLRLDSMWAAGIGLEWQWTPTRAISATLNYIQLGDAPLTSPSIPGIGSVSGEFTDRGTIYLEVGVSFGTGAASR